MLKTNTWIALLFFWAGGLGIDADNAYAEKIGQVVLLHGIARSSASMEKIADALSAQSYRVLNVDYPSTEHSLLDLVETIHPKIADFNRSKNLPLHIVTYSMGGLVCRGWIEKHRPENLGRVVMLSPPNRGSEMADFLKDNFLFQKFYGPAGQQLGTDQQNLHSFLGKVDFELGVIAGDRSIDPLGSYLIPGADDGKVSVERTKLEGMQDHIVLHATHTFIMKNAAAIAQTLYFLREGKFKRD